MGDDQQSRHSQYASATKHSMKRRANFHDYTSRRMYMITMTTEGRLPLFGPVVGDTALRHDRINGPHIVLSPLGAAVADCWNGIPTFHPEVSIRALQMMPDHLHGVLFVERKMERSLGKVINGFIIGCNKAFRLLCPDAYASAVQKQTERKKNRQDHEHGLLFSHGYNDKILSGEGELEAWLNYLADNPYRLLVKRENSDLFRVQHNITRGSDTFSVLGNVFLLDHPEQVQVQCSRRLTPEQIAETVERALAVGRAGGVLVTPSVSPGERECSHAAFEHGYPIIILRENGFSELEKPKGRAFDACAEGRLLFVAPWEHHNERRVITRAQCLSLNDLAARLCKGRRL